MKVIKLGVLIIIILIAGLAAFASMRPDHFKLERSTEIKASPEKVYGAIVAFKEWTKWSPWEGRDPNQQRIYSGPDSAVGQVYEWKGNKDVGHGKMSLVAADPGKLVGIRLEFIEPFPATNETRFELSPTANSGTKVKWVMEGDYTSIVHKIFSLFFSMEKMVGPDFEAGLLKLKQVSEMN